MDWPGAFTIVGMAWAFMWGLSRLAKAEAEESKAREDRWAKQDEYFFGPKGHMWESETRETRNKD